MDTCMEAWWNAGVHFRAGSRELPLSLPVLLRRLCELNTDQDIADAGLSLAGDILLTLGFDESGPVRTGVSLTERRSLRVLRSRG